MPKRQESKRIKRNRVIAVIDIGSSAIRLVVAQVGVGGMMVLDHAERPVALGRDVFTNGKIGRKTSLQALEILAGFKEMIAGYPVSTTIAIGTSALREAENRDIFADRVLIQTGFEVRIIEGIEANRLTYLAVREALHEVKPSITRSNSMIIEVGGGSTELMLLKRGGMVGAHTLPIGTIRMQDQLKPAPGSPLATLLRQHIRTTLEILESEIELSRINQFVATGGDARFAASIVGKEKTPQHSVIDRDNFLSFVDRLSGMSTDDIVTEFGITYADAEPLLPGLLVYSLFFERTAAKRLIVPSVSIREGVLLDFALGTGALRSEFKRQIIASALSLQRKYNTDETHAAHVAKLSVRLFDELHREHGLGFHDRLLLEVASLLHDIGTFISGSSHHKHGLYILQNSELFGLGSDDIAVVASIVRYHRRAKPSERHGHYMALSREKRMVVRKLSAILRVADALDRAHSGRLEEISAERREDQFILHTNTLGDLSLERRSLEAKGDLFEDVFGMQISLR